MRNHWFCLVVLMTLSPLQAAERLPLEVVNLEKLVTDTQKHLNEASGVGLVWIMPQDVFLRLLTEGNQLPPAQVAEIRDLLQGKCVAAVVRAHVSTFGTFTFFDEATMQHGTEIAILKPNRDPIVLTELGQIPQDLSGIIQAMKPVLANAIGRMGENMHFFVYDNAAPDGSQLFDPYKDEKVQITFAAMGQLQESQRVYDTICDSLFKPRLCQNGRPAHVTWKYDPWTGEKLPE